MPANRLLASLHRKDRKHLIQACDEVELSIGDVIWDPQTRIRHVYFPLDCLISLQVPTRDCDNLEFALVGNEGMIGTERILGVNTTSAQAVVKGSGNGLRMDAVAFCRDLNQLPGVRQQFNRYVHVLQSQLALAIACLSLHSLDLRLARSLLMAHDRSERGSFYLTHKSLALMLGVRRVGVTNAAGLLQKRKFLRYSRGKITILDRAGLEAFACPCYQVSQDVYENLIR